LSASAKPIALSTGIDGFRRETQPILAFNPIRSILKHLRRTPVLAAGQVQGKCRASAVCPLARRPGRADGSPGGKCSAGVRCKTWPPPTRSTLYLSSNPSEGD